MRPRACSAALVVVLCTACGDRRSPALGDPIAPRIEEAPAAAPAEEVLRTAIAAAGRREAAVHDERPDLVRFEGTVVLPPGVPRDERAFVVVADWLPDSSAEPPPALVGPDGSFTLSFPEDVDWACVAVRGRYLYSEECEVDLTETLTLEAKLGGVLRGRLRVPDGYRLEEQETDRPVVLAADADRDDGNLDVAALGAGLTFELLGLPPTESLFLFARLPGLAPAVSQPASIRAGVVHELDVVLDAGVGAKGVVVDELGRPLADAVVFVSSRVDSEETWRALHPGAVLGDREREFLGQVNAMLVEFDDDYTQTTDESGRFFVRYVAPGELSVHVEAQGFLDHDQDLGVFLAGENAEDLRVSMDPGLSLAGRLRWSDGSPVAEESVLWSNGTRTSSFRTDDEGSFAVRGLEPGPCRLTVTASHDFDAPERPSSHPSRIMRRSVLEVPAGTIDAVLDVEGDARLIGRVIDADGRPIGAFRLHAEGDEGEVDAKYEDTAGAFELRVPVGRWTIQVTSSKAGSSRPREVRTGLTAEKLVLTAGEPLTIRGVVRSPSGPLEGARVWATSVEESVLTDAAGRYELSSPCAETIRVYASCPGFVQRWASCEPTGGDRIEQVDLELPRGARIQGVLFHSDGSPARGATLRARSDGEGSFARTDENGAFHFDGVPAGEIRLHAEVNGEVLRDAAPFRLRAGDELTRDLHLVRGLDLVVRLLDASGTPCRAQVTLLDAERDAIQRKSGRTCFFGPLASGAYTLEATQDERVWSRAVDLAADLALDWSLAGEE